MFGEKKTAFQYNILIPLLKAGGDGVMIWALSATSWPG